MASPTIQSRWQQFNTLYYNLTHHIVPGPNAFSYAVPCILLPTALLIPPTTLSHHQLASFFFPVICSWQIHAWLAGGIDVIGVNLLLWSFVLLVLRDPRRTHRRIWVSRRGAAQGESEDSGKILVASEGSEGEVVREEPYPEDLRRRVSWILTLLVSLRLTGWEIGETSHNRTQPPPTLSRVDFLRIAGPMVFYDYLIMDFTSSYTQIDPYFNTSNLSVDTPIPVFAECSPFLLVMLRLLPPRLVRSSVLAAQAYAMVTFMFFLPTIPAIGLNAIEILPDEWSPHTWPVFFGQFSNVWKRGLRGLWGSWWHSMNRQITATPGHELAVAIGLPAKSSLAFAMLTVSAFFFSGVIHMGLIPPEPKSELMTANMMRLIVGAFFWLQVPAFAVEIAVAKMTAAFIPTARVWRLTRLLVLMWVACWMCLTLPLLALPFREIGYWHYYAVPVSLLRGVAGKGWITW